jgi:DNA repair ATPase RecN
MIVGLANDVCAYISEIDRLDKIKNNLSVIESSYKVLQAIIKDVNRLIAYTTIIGWKLPDAIQENLHQECERILSDIIRSHNDFDHDFRQEDTLSSAEYSLQETIKKVENQWHNYANEWAREPLQLFNLVKYLSEVKVQIDIYDDLKTNIQYFINKVPESLQQLTIFEQDVLKLSELLNTIELDVDVRAFLQKVIDGQATMKDLTAEIRAWCQSGDREHDFLITIVM